MAESFVITIGVLDAILLENGFGGCVLIDPKKPIYRSRHSDLMIFVDNHAKVVEFEIVFGRADGRNEMLMKLRDALSKEYVVSECMYSLGVYEHNVFVYNSMRFVISNVEFMDTRNWNYQLIRYDEYIYNYELKQNVVCESIVWFGKLNIHLYHPQCQPRLYNMIVSVSNEGSIEVFSEFIRELTALNDILRMRSCSGSSISGCMCEIDIDEENSPYPLLQLSTLDDTKTLIANIDCAKRRKGVYSVRQEMKDLITKY